ncbi:MAG: hypothetical protein R2772_05570 [Chitinophagales bacterium]
MYRNRVLFLVALGDSYTWNNGVTDGQSFTPPVGTTTYVVTGTDANGCVNQDSIDILVNPLPVVVANTSDNNVCIGTNIMLSGSGALTYTWNNGIVDGQSFTPPVGTTTYVVTGTDANGCVNQDSIDILVNPLPVVVANTSASTICEAFSITLSGSGAVSYTWDNGVIDAQSFVPPVGTTTYVVTGTDANACVNQDSLDIVVNALPTVGLSTSDNNVCIGTSIVLSGTGALTYTWNNGVTDGQSFTPPVGTTTYVVTGTDANGCINQDSIDIVVNPLPVVVANTSDNNVCIGTNITLSGSGALTYTWNNGIVDGQSFTPPVGSTTYVVTGTDANGCVNQDSLDIVVNPLPVVVANTSASTVCETFSITLSGSGAVTYTWDNGVIDAQSFVPPVGTTTYVVSGTDANGCVNQDSLDIVVNALPIVGLSTSDNNVCIGTSIVLSGTGAVSYTWNNGVSDGQSFVPPVGTTTYVVTGTDANGCINQDSIDILVNPLPVVVANTNDNNVCIGTNITLSGSGAVAYTWNNGVVDGQSFAPPVGSTTYVVTGTDANGCVNQDSLDIAVNPLPVVVAQYQCKHRM